MRVKQTLSFIYIIGVISISLIAFNTKVEAFSGSGTGSGGDPYNITSCLELQEMNDERSVSYQLANNIDCSDTTSWNSGQGFIPVGNTSTKFTGSLNGNSYTISDLFIDYTGSYAGLFGYTNGATIEDINLTNVDVTASTGYVGGLIGLAATTSVLTNVSVSGVVSTSGSSAGGIVGQLNNSHLYDSNSSVDVGANSSAGSAIGYISATNNTGSIVDNSYATGDVRADSINAGGFVGSKTYGTISNSYATGTILGDQSFGTTNTSSGGFVGNFCYGIIERSYATGDVYGADDIGGFYGQSHNCPVGVVRDSYARGDIYPSAGGQGGSFGAYIYAASVVRSYATGTLYGGQTNAGFIYWAHTCSSCSDNFFDLETTGQSVGGVLNSGSPTGKTTLEMQDIATFTDTVTTGLSNPWDFVSNPNDDVANDDVWTINPSFNDGYPFLVWQVNIPEFDEAGTEGDPILISDCEELQTIDNMFSTIGIYFELTNDIDCSDTINWNSGDGFIPIGDTYSDFGGYFEGNNHTISDLYIDRDSADNIGLFGATDDGTTISNLTLENPVITGDDSVGALVGESYSDLSNISIVNMDIIGDEEVGGIAGWSDSADADNVRASGSLYSDGDHAGGLFSYFDDGTLSNCSFSGDMETGYETGGIVGENEGDLTIHRCFSEGSITATSTDTGGIIGEVESDATITESYSTMDVLGEDAGGLVGTVYGNLVLSDSYFNGTVGNSGDVGSVIGTISSSYDVTVTNTYGTGQIIDGDAIGGFTGNPGQDDIYNNSFWDTETTGLDYGCDDIDECQGVLGKTTNEMKNSNTFINSDWNFFSIWAQNASINNGYPCLQWQTDCVGYTNASGQNDSDNDGTADSVESAGPNSGDANNDGNADANQANVASYLNPVNNKYVVLEVSETCFIRTIESKAESVNIVQDTGFDYPSGFMNFTMNCAEENGFVATINFFYYGAESDVMLRKYNPNTNAYFNVDSNYGLITSAEKIGGESATKVTYLITDGGDLDMDNTADGNISDPVGIAESVLGTPNTGYKLVR